MKRLIPEFVPDYLAAGIGPTSARVFPYSAILKLDQMLLPFLSLVSLGRGDSKLSYQRVSNEKAQGGIRDMLSVIAVLNEGNVSAWQIAPKIFDDMRDLMGMDYQ